MLQLRGDAQLRRCHREPPRPPPAPSEAATRSRARPPTAKDIVATAMEAGTFSTLLTAATAAGLVETLEGEGPFTVFAPTDEAFAALPEGTLESLLADPEALKQVLLYHVVSGEVTADQVVGLTSADSVEGSPIAIAVKDGSVFLNDAAEVVTTDVMASNGVIHVIDRSSCRRPTDRPSIVLHREGGVQCRTPSLASHKDLDHARSKPAGDPRRRSNCLRLASPPCAGGTSAWFLHAVQGIAVLALATAFVLPVTANFMAGPPARRSASRPRLFDVSVAWASRSSCSSRPSSTGSSPRRASSGATSPASRRATTTSAGPSTRCRRR